MSSIIIGRPKLKGNTITNEITVPKKLRQFVKRGFYATYDEEINCDESIQVIPALASMLPLAWMAEVDIKVKRLDQGYYESMSILQKIYKEVYPKGPFKTKIIVDDLVLNETKSDKVAMTFSGGLDSMYILASIHEMKPRLITLFRFTHRAWRKTFFERVTGFYRELATKQSMPYNIIDTNIRDILPHSAMNRAFSRYVDTTVWGAVQGVVIQLSATAPLSVGRFGRLYMASSFYPEAHEKGWTVLSSRPSVDNTIKWADLEVENYGYMRRKYKIPTVTEYMDETGFKLCTCVRPSDYRNRIKFNFDLNCGKCEKCIRTIVMLLILGYDPNKYGYEVTESSLRTTKKNFRSVPSYLLAVFWRPMQKDVPEKIPDFYGREFLEWFRSAKL